MQEGVLVDEPTSRWKQTTLALLCLGGLCWVLYQGFVRAATSISEASRQFSCGLETKVLETGQKLKHHPNGCGWVPVIQSRTDPSLPYVSPDAYVGIGVTVRDNAKVMEWAQLDGVTVVSGTTVIGPYQVVKDNQTVPGIDTAQQ